MATQAQYDELLAIAQTRGVPVAEIGEYTRRIIGVRRARDLAPWQLEQLRGWVEHWTPGETADNRQPGMEG